ncbi:M50 family metallopeptidase [Hymenobacter sp. BT683]|uniref:M50 family metallopeptidase n=1 Tax=Hymenobacter jeongseonensis TaxID=2791027 RepID=A0ABS0IFE2_9BACT|nr:M50 family metallopeptidase [Hymenobacter jeongseonensis]MBF9237040.1 M50 family metallopeptidase [Hymenobacter jeongseonensis]
MKKFRKPLVFALCALLGAGVGVLGARYGPAWAHPGGAWSRGQVLGLLLSLPLAWLLAVLLHELGHVAAGHWQSFRFYWLAVGPFMWKKKAGRVRFEWNKNLNTAGGMALSVPPDDHELRRRFIAFALGGPLASLVWAGVAIGLFALLPAAPGAGQVLMGTIGASGGISGLLVVLTLVPMQLGGFSTDGARAVALWRNGPAGQLELAVLAATVRSIAGVRPRELQGPLLEAAAALPDELPFKLYVYHYLYLMALDAGATEAAGRHLAAYRDRLAQMPTAMHASVWLESAFFAAAHQHDLAAARAFQAQAQVTSFTPADLPARVEAALARFAGEADRARAQAQLALQELPNNLDQGSAQHYAEWLNDTLEWASQTDSNPGRMALVLK